MVTRFVLGCSSASNPSPAPARAFRAEASFPVARAGYDDERVAELLRTRGRGPIDHRSGGDRPAIPSPRSEEHTSELQSLMRTLYAVLCLKKKNTHTQSEV